jgi:addiction module HigA family antidote
MAEIRPFEPDWSVAPGVVLVEALEERSWSQAELARRTDRPLKTINEIVHGKAAITPDTAIQFERVMGIPARLWLNLERMHAEAVARDESRRQLSKHISWLECFPIADLQKHDKLPRTRDKVELLEALLRFLGASSPDAWERQWDSVQVALRRSPSLKPKSEALSAWLRWGELEAPKESRPFDATMLRAAIHAIRAMTTLDPVAFEQPLQDALMGAGVTLLLIPELSGARITGAARWLDGARAAIQLSLRHKRDDQFWFAVFHECGHLLEGIRRRTYVDLVGDPSGDPDEKRADEFARDALIERAAYEMFIAANRFDASAVKAFARDQSIAPGIVVGRLRRDGYVGPNALPFLIRTFDWG